MKRDLWNELVRRARFEETAVEAAPFGFENLVLERVGRARRNASPWAAWVPFLRPALGIAVLLTTLSVAWQLSHSTPAARDLLVETDTLIHAALFNE